ncbi:MAG: DUF2318 domain-containing protein [Deltaproteobacteria bacterium]|nr:DUF2318 domain-containing protein [Deltaproteobacteria bacterium]
MLQFLVQVTEKILPFFLLIGFLLGYIARRDLLEVRFQTKSGLGLGALAAAALALLEFTTALVVREYYNLAVLILILATEILLFLLLLAGRALPPEKIATPPLRLLFLILPAAWGAFYLPDIFIFPSHFAVGTVKVFSSEFVFIATGYLLGLLLALLAGHSLRRVCAALPLQRLFPLFSLALLAAALSQLGTLWQILVARRLVATSDFALDLAIFCSNNKDLPNFVLLGLAALAALSLGWKSRFPSLAGENPAQIRKARSRARGFVRWSVLSLALAFSGFMVLTAGAHFNTREVVLSPPVEMPAADGLILLPLTLVGDGSLHRFVHKSERGINVRYIVIKKSATAYGVGLDACDVCGPSGYYERKGQVICYLCDVVMNKSTIGFAGGCNPVPLKFTLHEGNIVIKISDLEAEAHRFM